mmetsp:Transcript_13662/g.25273  ORF Transcript_13662/g.25273 Transcript_13662/m.25273 type:complete len:427 (-) Transcript_13662:106-1386(-)|eukprot:CAMPEP_0184509222 /NCGR_PEP_ID=MMETSP0198_2-20121128/1171_1 /TAXON_ID=1112570 /ORGANISM="Thraustochytrium sp., Strain LLF1b" /LENGTH=426 /DNA_ID=CAMNT_0026899043 /DNA_START=155 /DNA_END=1435 /DNA_ORIENTATION=+
MAASGPESVQSIARGVQEKLPLPRIKSMEERYKDMTLEELLESPYVEELANEKVEMKRNARIKHERLSKCDQEKWAAQHHLNEGSHLRLFQITNLLKWFKIIDKDDSGDISLVELADPLLTTGLADSLTECVEIFSAIDEDGSGEIDFEEFLQLITIKSSGKLDRERKRKNTSGVQIEEVSASEKKGGILAVLEKLNSDQNNSLTLTTAIGMERRKFLLQAVMPELDRLPTKAEKKKLSSIRNLLFASQSEKRKTLSEAATRHLLFPPKSSKFTKACPIAARQAKKYQDFTLPRPDMPWQSQKRTPASSSPQAKAKITHLSRCASASKVLPKVQALQAQQGERKRIAFHRARGAAGPSASDEDTLGEIQLFRAKSRLTTSASVSICKANRGITRQANTRAKIRSKFEPFQEYLRAVHDPLEANIAA